ncbi:MAG: DUF4197 domain-containing protein [Armatimonadetes bacterium]|nr:DUF4197 domain-containing protein [Armatimonadota bacterium]
MRRTHKTLLPLLFFAGWAMLSPGSSSAAAADHNDNGQISAGLREALFVSSDAAISLTGTTDGFFRNPEIKIPLPRQLKPLNNGLRAVGQGRSVDEFVLSMNRAAERAVPVTRSIFTDAIRRVTFNDARKILQGGDTAVTDFFREKTSDQLATAFLPIVERSMGDVGATRKYKELTRPLHQLPFGRSASMDLDGYVVDKALDGLFHVMGEEERRIRRNPAKHLSRIIRVVFGQLNLRR